MIYLLIVIPALSAATFIVATIKRFPAKRLVFLKGLASVLFVCLCPILHLLTGMALTPFSFSMLFIGLCFGAVGDVLLGLKYVYKNREALFFALGLSAFLIGHIFYIFFFGAIAKFDFLSTILAVNISALSLIALKVFKCSFGKMAAPVIVYAIIISIMVSAASSLIFLKVSSTSIIILIAAILFYLSDAVLSLIYFKKNSPKYLVPINLSLYYTAQIMLSMMPLLFSL